MGNLDDGSASYFGQKVSAEQIASVREAYPRMPTLLEGRRSVPKTPLGSQETETEARVAKLGKKNPKEEIGKGRRRLIWIQKEEIHKQKTIKKEIGGQEKRIS